MRKFILLLTALYFTLPVNARPQSGYYTDPALDELRIEIDDLNRALKSTQVEFNLLEEKVKKQDGAAKVSSANKDASSSSLFSVQVNALEKKISNLEKTLEKAANDLRTLSNSATQALNKIQALEQDIASHEKRFEEVSKLKGTLTTISKAISQKPSNDVPTPNATKSYRVKAGDSLEKIARNHHTSADTLRKINILTNDKIVVGQELRLPDDSP
jgi:LysM repeat protein